MLKRIVPHDVPVSDKGCTYNSGVTRIQGSRTNIQFACRKARRCRGGDLRRRAPR
jgi:hypothetical protein